MAAIWHRGDMVIRPAYACDRGRISRTLAQRWGSTMIVTRGRFCDAASLAALVAVETTSEQAPERVGLMTYRLDRGGLEVVTLDALRIGAGIGTALLSNGVRIARDAGAARVWLITTNDNLRAISFYERLGFRVIAVHEGAVDLARLLKPSIPLVAENGIELHDELELELTV